MLSSWTYEVIAFNVETSDTVADVGQPARRGAGQPVQRLNELESEGREVEVLATLPSRVGGALLIRHRTT